MSLIIQEISAKFSNAFRISALPALLVAVLVCQVFGAYRIPAGVTLLPVATPAAGQQVFQSAIVNDTQWAYLIYLPPGYDANSTKLWPLLISLPAFSYSGTSGNLADIYTTHMQNGGPAELLQYPEKSKAFANRFIIITPYIEFGMFNSHHGKPAALHSFFSYVVKQSKIDTTQITMMGYCFGSGISYTYATVYPTFASHLVLMAGNDNWASTFDLTKACNLKNIAIRQYADSTCTCGDGPTARVAYNAINACGTKNDSITYFKTGYHEVWATGNVDTATSLYDWMLTPSTTAVAPQHETAPQSRVSSSFGGGDQTIQVIGLNGQVLMTRNVKNGDMAHALSTLNRGMYLVRSTVGNKTIAHAIVNK